MRFTNPFAAPGQWFRGNLHTHTSGSDGRFTPEETAERYRAAGYDFLALTDHGVVIKAASPSDDFLLLLGTEMNGDTTDGGDVFHICAFGLQRGGKVPPNPGVQQAVDWARAHGGEAVLAHPYWSGLVLPDFQRCQGYLGIEVFNTTCQVLNGKGCSAAHWDNLLARGRQVWGLAVDDMHGRRDITIAWVMVKAQAITRQAIMRSLRSGMFYSSWGPTIRDIAVEGRQVRVKVSPSKAIHFVAQEGEGRTYAAAGTQLLTEATYELRGHERYLRLECQDIEGRWAWSNPLFVKERE
jgi:hypothetical protein